MRHRCCCAPVECDLAGVPPFDVDVPGAGEECRLITAAQYSDTRFTLSPERWRLASTGFMHSGLPYTLHVSAPQWLRQDDLLVTGRWNTQVLNQTMLREFQLPSGPLNFFNARQCAYVMRLRAMPLIRPVLQAKHVGVTVIYFGPEAVWNANQVRVFVEAPVTDSLGFTDIQLSRTQLLQSGQDLSDNLDVAMEWTQTQAGAATLRFLINGTLHTIDPFVAFANELAGVSWLMWTPCRWAWEWGINVPATILVSFLAADSYRGATQPWIQGEAPLTFARIRRRTLVFESASGAQ